MAGKSLFAPITVVDLTDVRGGVDKQTQAARQVLDQATVAADKVARSVAPKGAGMSQVLLHLMASRSSGAGPTSAPALPPTTHLTR